MRTNKLLHNPGSGFNKTYTTVPAGKHKTAAIAVKYFCYFSRNYSYEKKHSRYRRRYTYCIYVHAHLRARAKKKATTAG
jgi:hypothetical protein